ncbi:MAG: glycoside hydrolase family 1 [Opitutales bacterium]|nr:glycoside hydrolase family 1 [Opitutales bacterium]
MLSAFWVSGNTGAVLLDRDWTNIWSMPPLKLSDGNAIREIVRLPQRLAGATFGYYIQGKYLVFVLAREIYRNYYISANTPLYVAGDFNDWNPFEDSVWHLQPVINNDLTNFWEVRVPLKRIFPDGKKSMLMFKFVTGDRVWLNPPSFCASTFDKNGNANLYINPARTGMNAFRFVCGDSDFGHDSTTRLIWDEKNNRQELLPQHTLINMHLFSPLKMGASVERDKTTFRLFAPRAGDVSVEYWRASGARTRQKLRQLKNGVWEAVVPANLDHYFYCYRVNGKNIDNTTRFDPDFEILDPYALAAVGPAGPGIVIDDMKWMPPVKKRFQAPDMADLVICEVHLRDLIARVPEFAGKKDLGFKELAAWIRGNGNYIRRLGINAVELQPVQQFDAATREEYHWGYMTTNYFSPASNYGSNPAAGTQIREFRELVEAFHQIGVAVILDVVYNHVGEPNHLHYIDKDYYFALDQNGNFTNWSGCGNDLDADEPMSHRILYDSLLWLLERYGVDGFRFDLAELIGVPALKSLEYRIREKFPRTILIAEPWSFRGHIAYNLKHTTYSSWNDGFRDYCAKYVFNQVNLDGFRYFMAGSTDFLTRFPTQTVNYCESHDDRAWLDKISECPGGNAENPTENDIRRTRIMLAMLLSALGVPMLAQGQDFLRTKHGKNNTYLDGEENALDYRREERFAGFAKYVRRWIAFRLSPLGRLFRQRARVTPTFFRFYPDQSNTAAITVYNNDGSQGLLKYLLMINPRCVPATIQAQTLSMHGFKRIANSNSFDAKNGVPADPGFAVSKGVFTLPPLSVSLWIKEKY